MSIRRFGPHCYVLSKVSVNLYPPVLLIAEHETLAEMFERSAYISVFSNSRRTFKNGGPLSWVAVDGSLVEFRDGIRIRLAHMRTHIRVPTDWQAQ